MPDQQRAVSESAAQSEESGVATNASTGATRSTGNARDTAVTISGEGTAPDGTSSTVTTAGDSGTAGRTATVSGAGPAAPAEGTGAAASQASRAAGTPATAAGGTTGDTTATTAHAASAPRARWSARALFRGSSDGHAEGATATAPASSDDSADGSVPGRPKKPVLAAAAMAGAVLIAVPLLVLVTSGEDDSDKVASTGSADTLLGGGDEPPGAFVAATPTAGKTDAAKKNAPDKDGVKEQGDKEAPAPPVPGKEATTKAPSTASPTLGSASTVREKDAVIRKAPSNVPAVLTRVLIKNNTNSTCVDIPGAGSGAPDGRIVQSTCNSHPSDNQLWNVEQRYADAGPGGAPLFQIRNVVDSMCLDLPGYTGVGGGTKVTEYPCNGTTADNQLWWFDKQPDGKFWLRNYASNNQCLDSYDANTSVRNLFIWPCAQESRNNHEWFTTLR